MRLTDLDTPALTVDLDAVERNIERMQGYCDEHGLDFRPHIKTHKLPAIAYMQLRAGAKGITCQKLGEAEVMAAAGIDDILVTFPLIGASKAERFAALARAVKIGAVADSVAVANYLSRALASEELTAELLVECDTGYGRTGVQTPAEALELARLTESLPGLHFAGLMTYPTLLQTGPWIRAARELFESEGLAIERVSGGGTPTAFATHDIGGITELRAGSYVYGDLACVHDGSVPLEDCALRVRATVASRPTPERAILDAGSKTLTNDPSEGTERETRGLVLEHPEARIYALSEEHGHVDVSRCADPPQIGDVVTIVPNHACGTTNMHNEVIAHREGNVVARWPVAARGLLR